MKKILFSVVLLLSFIAAAYADYNSDVSSGVKAYKAGDYSLAYKFFKSAYAAKPSKLLGQYLVAAYKKSKSSGDNLLQANGLAKAYGDWSTRQNIIRWDPAYFMLGFITLHYERMLSPVFSAGLHAGMSFSGATYGGTSSNGTSASGSGVMFGGAFNWYPESKSPNGWFMGPELDIYNMSQKYTTSMPDYSYYSTGTTTISDTATESLVTAGVHGGYRWIFGNGFSMDTSLGLVMFTGKITTKSVSDDTFYNDDSSVKVGLILPTVSFNVGYAF
jgi:hypothetical protein